MSRLRSDAEHQPSLFSVNDKQVPPAQFLKWVGNKQRFASQIASYVPAEFNCYFEPFVGSGAVLGAIAPRTGVASDVQKPLVGIWKLLQSDPVSLLNHYRRLWDDFQVDRLQAYNRCKDAYNADPNPHDLLFLCRSCYGGIVRFRKHDGFMSTPIGPHNPISPESLKKRMEAWRLRLRGTTFRLADFSESMALAKKGDVVYCDPPYAYSQAILYGAQSFQLTDLWNAIESCVARGATVMLSLDGHKKSGTVVTQFEIPDGIFKREVFINCGRSMLRRFQRAGETLEDEVVHDRLLLSC